MKLVDNWREVLRRAWSIKFMLLASVLSGTEVLISMLQPAATLPPGVFAAVAGLVTAMALVARLLAQGEAEKNHDPK